VNQTVRIITVQVNAPKREVINMANEVIDDKVIDEFLVELEALYRKYGLSIAHQDAHGAFIIDKLGEENISWIKAADRAAKYR
jgi:hypothetical protein